MRPMSLGVAGLGGRTTGALAAAAGILLLLPLAGVDPFFLDVLTTAFLFAVFSGSWDIVGGVAGQVSLGHALFFGAATYGCAVLTSVAGWPFPAAAAAALLLSGLLGAAVGAIAAPLHGPFVALVTLAIGELAHEMCLTQTLVSPRGGYSWGGEGGIPVAALTEDASPWVDYYAALGFFVVASAAMLLLARSRQGLVWTALSGSELSARASGVDVTRHKRRAFVAGALFAGAAGIGFAAHVGRATAADFSIELSFQAATFAAIGGRGTILGPVFAALLLQAVLQGIGLPPSARVFLYATALLVTLRFLPAGVAGALRDRARARMLAPAGRRKTG